LYEIQVSLARTYLRNANKGFAYILDAYSDLFERNYDLFEEVCKSAEGYWMTMFPNFHLTGVTNDSNKPILSEHEQEILARTRPDYSNLRAAASGTINRRSVIDDDSLWPAQQTTAKSLHKYDEADRDFNRQNDFA
jgi:hypothetical protein